MAKPARSDGDSKDHRSADSTGRYSIRELRASFPAGLKIRVEDAELLTDEGKRAIDNGVLTVDKVAK